MDNMQKNGPESRNKEPIPIDIKKLKKASVFDNIKLIFSLIAVVLILLAVSAYYIYSIPYTSVVVEANSSINLKLNKWNKVINASALDTNGNTILNDANLKFKDIDDALIIIVNKAEANNFLKSVSNSQTSSVIVYISGNQLQLPNFYMEAKNKSYDIQINENGTEKFNNFKKDTANKQ